MMLMMAILPHRQPSQPSYATDQTCAAWCLIWGGGHNKMHFESLMTQMTP
jgi:hypothetical protein